MSRARSITLLGLVAMVAMVAAAAACGARTSLAPGVVGDGDGDGGGDAGQGGAAATSSGGGSGGGCVAESFGGPATQGAYRLEADATHVYWTTVDGRVMRARLGGGTAETLIDGQDGLSDLALHGDRVIFGSELGVASVPRAGGESATLLVAGPLNVVALAADDSGIYWLSGGGGIFDYTLERLAPDGTRTALVDPIDYAIGLALQGEEVVFTAMSLPGVDAFDLVARVPKAGGPVEVLATDRPDPTNVFVHQGDLFWTEQFDVFDGPVGVVRLRAGEQAPEHVLVAPRHALPILSAAGGDDLVLTALHTRRGALLLRSTLGVGVTEVLAEGPGFFLDPAVIGDRVAVTFQPPVDDPDALGDAEVEVLCLR